MAAALPMYLTTLFAVDLWADLSWTVVPIKRRFVIDSGHSVVLYRHEWIAVGVKSRSGC